MPAQPRAAAMVSTNSIQRTEIAADDAVPGGAMLPVEFFFNESCDILLDIELV